MRIWPLVFSLVCFGSPVLAQEECSSVIALSRISSSTTVSSSELTSHANAFCSEYAQAKSSNKTVSAGASYKFLSGTFSSGNATADEVASKYCSASNSYAASDQAYASYINAIAPGAYDAYIACVSSVKKEIRFQAGSVLPKEFTATVSNKIVGTAVAKIRSTPSTGVKCFWDNEEIPTIEIKSPGTATLRCVREKADERSFVTLARSDGDEVITLPWQAYDDAGNPYDELSQLRLQIGTVNDGLTELQGDLSSAFARNTLTCATTAADSGLGRNISVEAVIPEELRGTHVVTGGGCEIPSFYGHFPPITISKPTATGWTCTANDPPNIPLPLQVRAHVVYCSTGK